MVGEDRKWGLSKGLSSDEARDECCCRDEAGFVETKHCCCGEGESLEANIIRFGEGDPLGSESHSHWRGGNPLRRLSFALDRGTPLRRIPFSLEKGTPLKRNPFAVERGSPLR